MKLSEVVFFCGFSLALARSIPIRSRSLVFRAESDVNYVALTPTPQDLTSFTLCLRVATELPQTDREIILFAYPRPGQDGFNLWREKNGTIGLYLQWRDGEEGVTFHVPPLGPMETHVCVTWTSSSGATAVFIDGKKSLTKFYKKNHEISMGGTVILGQDGDGKVGGFDAKQSFVGEISDVNLWSKVLPNCFIKEMATSGQTVQTGDVIDWKTVSLHVHGEVDITRREQ